MISVACFVANNSWLKLIVAYHFRTLISISVGINFINSLTWFYSLNKTLLFYFAHIQLIHNRKRASHEYEALVEGKEAHWEVVERILFIYTKLNPGIGYVQGMNELIGPLYYTLASDPNKLWKGKYVERYAMQYSVFKRIFSANSRFILVHVKICSL